MLTCQEEQPAFQLSWCWLTASHGNEYLTGRQGRQEVTDTLDATVQLNPISETFSGTKPGWKLPLPAAMAPC